MKNLKLFTIDTVWRIAPILVSAIWIASYIFQFYPKGVYDSSYFIITPENYYIPIILFGIMILLTAIFPFKFLTHGLFCWLFGLLWLIDGGLIIALSVHLFGYLFFYRHGFLKTHKKAKFLIGWGIILAAIASQLRFTDINMLHRLFHFISFAVTCVFAVILYKPEIQIIRKKRREKILALPSRKFSEEEAEILRKVIAGEKYEIIANEQNTSLSTFNRQIRKTYNKLGLDKLNDFLRVYANHTVVMEEEEKT